VCILANTLNLLSYWSSLSRKPVFSISASVPPSQASAVIHPLTVAVLPVILGHPM
jgi:hypothetical protein